MTVLATRLAYPFTTTAVVTATTVQASSLAIARAVAEPAAGTMMALGGRASVNDGGQGTFVWDATSTAADDGALTIAVSGVTTGRWKRVYTGPIDVRWFGAVGNGTTDDTTAIQNAINAVTTSGGIVFLPAGTYKITSALSLPGGVTLRGDGHDVTILSSSSVYPMIRSPEPLAGSPGPSLYGGLSDLSLTANNAHGVGSGYMVDATGWYSKTIRRVAFRNASKGIKICGDIGGTYGAYYGTFYDCIFDGLSVGAWFGYGGNEWGISKGRVNDCTLGVHLSGCSGTKVIGTSFEVGTTAIQLGDVTDNNNGTAVGCAAVDVRFEGLTSAYKFVREVGTQIRGTFAAGTVTTTYNESARQGTGTGSTVSYTILDDTNLTIAGGTRIKNRMSVTSSVDPGTVNANSTKDMLVTITGAASTDSYFVTPSPSIPASLMVMAIPASSNGCYVRFANVSGSPVTPGALTYRIDVWRN